MKKIVLFLLFTTLIYGQGDIAPVKYIINKGKNDIINLYSKPNANSKVIGELPYIAENLKFSKCKKSHSFCYLEFPMKGWVKFSFKYSDNHNILNVEPVKPIKYNNIDYNSLEGDYKVIKHNKGEFLNIRSGRGSEFKKIGEIPYNEKYIYVEDCIKNKRNYDWCWIEYNSSYGWISKKYIKPNIHTCHQAVKFLKDKEKILEYCKKDTTKKIVSQQIYSFLFLQKFNNIIKLYIKDRKILPIPDLEHIENKKISPLVYFIVSFAYEKLGNSKKAEEIIKNLLEWDFENDVDIAFAIDTLKKYNYLYPEDKENVNKVINYFKKYSKKAKKEDKINYKKSYKQCIY